MFRAKQENLSASDLWRIIVHSKLCCHHVFMAFLLKIKQTFFTAYLSCFLYLNRPLNDFRAFTDKLRGYTYKMSPILAAS